jgi:hypothetical protein
MRIFGKLIFVYLISDEFSEFLKLKAPELELPHHETLMKLKCWLRNIFLNK